MLLSFTLSYIIIWVFIFIIISFTNILSINIPMQMKGSSRFGHHFQKLYRSYNSTGLSILLKQKQQWTKKCLCHQRTMFSLFNALVLEGTGTHLQSTSIPILSPLHSLTALSEHLQPHISLLQVCENKMVFITSRVISNLHYYRFVGHFGAFCGLKLRTLRAKMENFEG